MGIKQLFTFTLKPRYQGEADPGIFCVYDSIFKRLSLAESYGTIYKCFTASINCWSDIY